MIDNLEWNDSSLATAKRLEVMISDKDVHSTDVLYHHCCKVCTPPPLSAGGIEPPTKFSKRGGGLTGPQLLEGDCWERGEDDFFHGGLQF